MRTSEQLKSESDAIQSFLTIEMSDDPQEVVERGNTLCAYLASTTEMLAEAKYLLNEAKRSEVMNVVKEYFNDKKLSAKVQNALVDGLCREQQYLVDMIERQNATITHQIDWVRSILSKQKEEMRLTNMGREFR
jgi:hypothetical protein